ncbi:hypothetical protein HQ550_04265 [bacterium]|nr:hypothetical protein [bacterium]
MNKKQLIIACVTGALILFTSNVYSQEISKKEGDLYLTYKGKQYEIMQYKDDSSLKFYGLQYWGKETELPKPLVLITDYQGKVVKEIVGDGVLYYGDMLTYDINNDYTTDLILIWQTGPTRLKELEVWINKDNEDFQVVFYDIGGGDVFFTIKNGIPTIVLELYQERFQDEKAVPNEKYRYLQWNGKTFISNE